jgi:hypothetical protein
VVLVNAGTVEGGTALLRGAVVVELLGAVLVATVELVMLHGRGRWCSWTAAGWWSRAAGGRESPRCRRAPGRVQAAALVGTTSAARATKSKPPHPQPGGRTKRPKKTRQGLRGLSTRGQAVRSPWWWACSWLVCSSLLWVGSPRRPRRLRAAWGHRRPGRPRKHRRPDTRVLERVHDTLAVRAELAAVTLIGTEAASVPGLADIAGSAAIVRVVQLAPLIGLAHHEG